MTKLAQTATVATTVLALALAAIPALAQVNAGNQQAEPTLPFTVTQVATFRYPWRIAFLPDGRMLVTEKVGGLDVVTQKGEKTPVTGIPEVAYGGQNGMLGVFLSPGYKSNHEIYLTYLAPGEGGSGLALARARLVLGSGSAQLEGLKVLWQQMPPGRGGQPGGQIAFSPDGKLLYLTVGDRMRMTVSQDPNQTLGKVVRLTLDGKPAPGNPEAGKTGAKSVPLINPPRDTERAKTAPVLSTYTFPGPNLAPAEIWASGFRTPYGLAFAPNGQLWEAEDGPRGGDELNLVEPGKNYGWPLAVYGKNYDGVPIPSPDTRPDLAKPVIYWNPVIAVSCLTFYKGAMFSQWDDSAFVGGLGSNTMNRVTFDGHGGATPAQRFDLGFRVRDIEVAPDGALWVLQDANPGGLYRLTPKS